MVSFDTPRVPTLTDKLLAQAEAPQAVNVLFALGLAEAIFFPVKTQAMLVPMCVFNRARAFEFGLIAALGSVAGGVIAYMVGYALSGLAAAVAGPELLLWLTKLQGWYVGYDLVAVGALGFAPIPFAIIAALNGLLHGGMLGFIVAAVVARCLRYGVVAWLLWKGGIYYKEWLEKNFFGFSMALSAGLVIVFMVLKLLYVSW